MRRLKEDAEARLGDQVDRAVITVPAYFADPQRKATIEAGQAAGFQVLRIINEPTAAALAYGLQKTGVEETVLIYDLGGGTFDVTVARITPDEIVILSTAGDHDLGGKNWDDRIATFLAERFAAETGFDPLDDPVALNEVLVRSEQAKWALSERNSTRITLQLGTERRSFELARAEFEAMTFPLMDRTRRLTEEALGEADLTWPRLDGVLLVGGSTRMPMVRTYVSQMAGKPPRTGVNVDEVVALGAAIQAAIEVGQNDRRRRSPLHALGRRPAGGRERRRRAQPPGDRRHVAQPGHDRRQPRRLELRQRHRDPPQPADPRPQHQVVPSRNPRRGQHPARGLSDAGREPDAARLHDPGQVRLRRHPRDRRRGDGRRRPVVRLQRRRAGAGRPARHGHRLPMTVEPVPDDLSWLGRPPETSAAARPPELIRVFLLIDVSSSMTGQPLDRGPDRRARVPVEVRLHDDGGRPDLVFDAGRAAVAGDEQCAPAARGGAPARGGGEHQPDRRPGDGREANWSPATASGTS